MPRSDFGQKVIFWAFYCRSSNFAALVRPLRARARAGDRPGHTVLAEYVHKICCTNYRTSFAFKLNE